MTTNADPYLADITARWRELSKVAQGITPTRLPLEPSPSDIRALRDDLEALIRAVDPLVEAYGEYAAAYSGHSIDQGLFRDQLLGALDGNALYEIESAAERLQEKISEAVA